MQTQGSLQETDLAELLQTMQTERVTGTLTLDHDSETCALYFLFGHLFHAASQSGGGDGEEVVLKCFTWENGTFKLDPRAKLPAEETVKSLPAELIAEAERRKDAVTQAVPVGVAATESTWTPSTSLRDVEPSTAYVPPDEPDTTTDSGEMETNGAVATSVTTDDIEKTTTKKTEPAAVSPKEPAAPVWSPPMEPVMPTTTPTPKVAKEAPRSSAGAQTAPPLGVAYPLPSGKPIYEGLKSAFVDFPKLLRTLSSDTHTGYVRLEGHGFSGALFLNGGTLLQALCSDGSLSTGTDALVQFRRQMDGDGGLLDVIELGGDTVDALAQLLSAEPFYTGLLGWFVNFDALLEYLNVEKIDGSVIVRGESNVGMILLRQGGVLGAYTQTAPLLSTSPKGVAVLATERQARIEVMRATGSATTIDVAAALSKPY